ncbi:MAG: hypothetical protein ACFFD4_00620 [Candidatus Odinarchaeota archaeon]
MNIAGRGLVIVIKATRSEVVALDEDILSLLTCIYCNKVEEDFELHAFKKEGKEIFDGILYCSTCHRYYMILDTVVYLVRDADRIKKDEMRFLKLYASELPEHVREKLKPSWEMVEVD